MMSAKRLVTVSRISDVGKSSTYNNSCHPRLYQYESLVGIQWIFPAVRSACVPFRPFRWVRSIDIVTGNQRNYPRHILATTQSAWLPRSGKTPPRGYFVSRWCKGPRLLPIACRCAPSLFFLYFVVQGSYSHPSSHQRIPKFRRKSRHPEEARKCHKSGS